MTQLEQINSMVADVKTIKRLLDKTTANAKSLANEHYNAGEVDPLYNSLIGAVIELRHSLPALRKLKSDAEILDGISANDGEAGTQKALARFNKKADSHIAQTAKKDVRKTIVKGGK